MTGDDADIVQRLKMVLPSGWFADNTPVLDALLKGVATAWAGLYTLLAVVRSFGRIATSTGIFLDIAARDFFGPKLSRRAGEADAAYSVRIRANLVAPRATRAGVTFALSTLTGRAPIIFEPRSVTDTGGYNLNLGYSRMGAYGAIDLPYQFFVTAYRPNATAISNAGGYDAGPGGYGTGPMAYVNIAQLPGMITDNDIYAAVAGVLPVCTTAWTRISN